MLYMEHFNAKVMLDFDKDDIPGFRMAVAGTLVDNRENEGDITTVMEMDLLPA